MGRVLNDDLIYEVLAAVSEISEGGVTTYGHIPWLIDKEKNFRLVSKVASMSYFYGKYFR